MMIHANKGKSDYNRQTVGPNEREVDLNGPLNLMNLHTKVMFQNLFVPQEENKELHHYYGQSEKSMEIKNQN